ncbi:MAG: potassium-transporting ATPase subunit KdpC [Terriglobales bacterium]
MRYMAPAFRLIAFFTVTLGVIYPLVVTGLCQWWFPRQANGSLLRADDRIVGSSLLGQAFTGPAYFHPRPSAAGSGYDPMASGGSNFAATNPALITRVGTAAAEFRRNNPAFYGPIPSDLLTASASGLDPDISPAAAYAQAPRVARTRDLPLPAVRQLVRHHVQGRQWGFLGEPRVNVLRLNLALQELGHAAIPPAEVAVSRWPHGGPPNRKPRSPSDRRMAPTWRCRRCGAPLARLATHGLHSAACDRSAAISTNAAVAPGPSSTAERGCCAGVGAPSGAACPGANAVRAAAETGVAF